MRIFGCACYPNLRPFNARKLEYRSTQCVFLGYSNLHKGFRCLDINSGQVYISRDVIFDETIFPFAKLHANAGQRLRSEILLLPSHPLNPSQFDHGGEFRIDPIEDDIHTTVAANNNLETMHSNAEENREEHEAATREENGVEIPSERHRMLHHHGTEAQGRAGPAAGETASPSSSRQSRLHSARATPGRAPAHTRDAGSSASPATAASSHTSTSGSRVETADSEADSAQTSADPAAPTRSAPGSTPDAAGSSVPVQNTASAVPRVTTRLQTGKIQPRQYKNMVRYANLAT
jgi:hypothetical protein